MEISKQDLERIYEKFVSDPDWKIVEALLNQFLEPLLDIRSIDTEGKTSDEVFAELMGRKLTADALSNFLSEVKLLKTSVTKKTQDSQFK